MRDASSSATRILSKAEALFGLALFLSTLLLQSTASLSSSGSTRFQPSDHLSLILLHHVGPGGDHLIDFDLVEGLCDLLHCRLDSLPPRYQK